MPSRSFYLSSDLRHLDAILLDANGQDAEQALVQFRDLGIAPLIDVASLARCMGISTVTIFAILHRKNKHYRRFELPKKSGGMRQISTPRTYLKVIQWWILDNILSRIGFPEYVTGFVRGQVKWTPILGPGPKLERAVPSC